MDHNAIFAHTDHPETGPPVEMLFSIPDIILIECSQTKPRSQAGKLHVTITMTCGFQYNLYLRKDEYSELTTNFQHYKNKLS